MGGKIIVLCGSAAAIVGGGGFVHPGAFPAVAAGLLCLAGGIAVAMVPAVLRPVEQGRFRQPAFVPVRIKPAARTTG